jgi:ABC-2 type transport system permease protein
MTAVLRVARMTVGQVLGVRRFVGLAALALLPGLIVYLSTARAANASRLETFAGVTVGFFFSVVVPVVALILSTSALGDERRDQTLSFIVLRPLSRASIAAAKILAAIGTACVISGIGAIGLGVAMGLRHGDWGYALPLVVGCWIATSVYASIFVPLGYLTERATLTGLAFVFIWEGAVAGAIGALASLSPWRIGFSAFVALSPSQLLPFVPDFALGNVVPGTGGALIKAAVVFVIGTWFTTWILTTRDLV